MKLSQAWVAVAIIQTVFSSSASREADLSHCTYSIITKYFTSDCLCFNMDINSRTSETIDFLIKRLSVEKSLYVIAPDYYETMDGSKPTLPVKPYPCSYVVNLSFLGSNITWYLLRGRFLHGDYRFFNESRFLIVSEVEHSVGQVFQVLTEVFNYGFLNVNFANPRGGVVDIYTLFPFGKDLRNCPEAGPSLVQVAVCVDGRLTERENMFQTKIPRGPFSGCKFNISCAYFSPYVNVKRGGRFKGSLPGYDAGPLSLLADRLNVTPQWFIDVWHLWNTVYPNGSAFGAIPDLIEGKAQMACGGLSRDWGHGNSDLTMFYTWASAKWFVAAPDKAPKWKMPFLAFTKWTWLSTFVVTTAVPVVYLIFTKLTNTKSSFSRIVMTFSAIMLGNSTAPPPISLPLRAILFSWMIYAFHMDQAYVASLTGLITTAEYEPVIQTSQQLIESNLPTCAYEMYDLASLSKDYPRKDIKKIISNHISIHTPLDYYLRQMSAFKNFTILDNQLFVKYLVSISQNVTIYPTQVSLNEYVIGALMMRHHYLFERINWLLIRMYDAGFPVYFLRQTIVDKFWTSSKNYTTRDLTMRDLTGPFFLWVVGLVTASFVFIGELAYFRTSNYNRKQRQKDNTIRKPRSYYRDLMVRNEVISIE